MMNERLCLRCRLSFKEPRWEFSGGAWRAESTHHETAESLQASLISGCPLCIALQSIVPPEQMVDCSNDRLQEFTSYASLCIFGNSNPVAQSRDVSATFWIPGKRGFVVPGRRSLNFQPHFSGKQDALRKITPLDDTTPAPTSVRWAAPVREWVTECVESHTECGPLVSSPFRYPTRLLQVGDLSSPTVQLLETTKGDADMVGPYNTLSYRWGNALPIRLLTTNIDNFRREIAVSLLPKTLADAIVVTRTMGVPYLWIDALCIIQDSTFDWEREASAMAEVYGHSYCNLAASHNHDSTGGLAPRLQGSLGRPFSVRITCPLGMEPPYLDTWLAEQEFKANRVDAAPLNSRGWVVQERALAQRTVHFTYDQPLFECRTLFDPSYGGPGRGNPAQRLPKVPARSDVETGAILNHYWPRILYYYTQRQLTQPSDRSRAIIGIARLLHERLGNSQYLAGLWSTRLLRQLLWISSQGCHPVTYCGPSWSWIGLQMGLIYYEETGDDSLDRFDTQVLGWKITTTDGSEFGSVTSASLHLKSPLHPLKVLLPADAGDFPRFCFDPDAIFDNELAQVSNSSCFIYWDLEDDPRMRHDDKMPHVFAAPIVETRRGGNGNHFELRGLVLLPIDGQVDVYCRVGMFGASGSRTDQHMGKIFRGKDKIITLT